MIAGRAAGTYLSACGSSSGRGERPGGCRCCQPERAVVACCTAALAGAGAGVADPEARSGPERNSVPQVTAPAPKMAAATQNAVVYPWISDIVARGGAGCPWTRV